MTGPITDRPDADRRVSDPVADDHFAALYRDQWWPMIRLAQGLVDDVSSAEDVVQDAFAGLYRGTAALADPGAAVRPSDDPPAVLTTEVRDVASGSCPQPFLAPPGHTYRIRCQVMLLAGVTGKAALTTQTPDGRSTLSMNVTDPAKHAASPSPSSSSTAPLEEAARKYSEALASAPEASKVASVSDRPATAEELRSGESTGSLDAPVPQPERGRTYPVTLLYIPSPAGPAISVLAIELEDVAAGRCPRAFRVRPGHAYVIRCHVAFTAGVVGKAFFRLTEPRVGRTMGKTISSP